MARCGLFTSKLSAILYFKNIRNSYCSTKYFSAGKIIKNQTALRTFSSVSKINQNLAETKPQFDPGSDSEHEESNDIGDLKLQILEAGLNFVPEHGWTKKSIALGANSLGLSTASHSLVEDGGADLVHYFNFLCKEKLELHLRQRQSSNETKPNAQNYVEDALVYRLQMVVPYAASWPEALALMVLPNQIPTDLKNLLELVDTIWCHSGDQSLNLSWYSKRLSLALAYRACELTLTQDKSEDFAETFCFLQRRVEDVMETNKIIHRVAETTKDLPKLSSGALITVRNLLGVNKWLR
ncbi:hypothetical protein JTE90_011490 [Oedothorax gibbosus]|uniref:Ubiquinone biosynthesis protein n=1 Tax=Oedothorax gibbosus TaxID=931172 RepID=A0AAV6VBH6_9ARAC|nr:hypothetical protein JTE90_011490 [Oedothorax gibbosus]